MLQHRSDIVDGVVAIFFLALVLIALYAMEGINITQKLWKKIKDKQTSL